MCRRYFRSSNDAQCTSIVLTRRVSGVTSTTEPDAFLPRNEAMRAGCNEFNVYRKHSAVNTSLNAALFVANFIRECEVNKQRLESTRAQFDNRLRWAFTGRWLRSCWYKGLIILRSTDPWPKQSVSSLWLHYLLKTHGLWRLLVLWLQWAKQAYQRDTWKLA